VLQTSSTKRLSRRRLATENRFNFVSGILLSQDIQIDLNEDTKAENLFLNFLNIFSITQIDKEYRFCDTQLCTHYFYPIKLGVICALALLQVCEIFVSDEKLYLQIKRGKTMMKPITERCFVKTENPLARFASQQIYAGGFSFFCLGIV